MIYAFGECTLDVARRELRHRDYLVAMEPKMFEVLLYLLLKPTWGALPLEHAQHE
jgi:hypothetical protein